MWQSRIIVQSGLAFALSFSRVGYTLPGVIRRLVRCRRPCWASVGREGALWRMNGTVARNMKASLNQDIQEASAEMHGFALRQQ
jgi:hypothetical protein